MNLIRFSLLSGLLLLSIPARAGVGESAVTNGATVQFAGTAQTTNRITINNGGAFIWNNTTALPVDVGIVGATLSTKGQPPLAIFTTDNQTGGGQIRAFTTYYVYYAQYAPFVGPAAYSFVISTIPPLAQGSPSVGLNFTIGGVPQQNDTQAVFLGSYVTDLQSNIVPFERQGDEVILAPTSASPFYWVVIPPIAFDGNPNTVYPRKQSNAGLGSDLPATAAAMIFDITVTSTSLNAADLYVLDPVLNATPAGCSLNSQLDISVPANGSATIHHARLKNTGGVVNLAACAGPGANHQYTATLSYVGWVEPIHHLF